MKVKTLNEVAKEIGVNAERTRQIEKRALEKLEEEVRRNEKTFIDNPDNAWYGMRWRRLCSGIISKPLPEIQHNHYPQ
jgi:hypothetical protein